MARIVPLDSDVGIGRRRATGADLLERLRETREVLEREAPEIAAMNWDELKAVARS